MSRVCRLGEDQEAYGEGLVKQQTLKWTAKLTDAPTARDAQGQDAQGQVRMGAKVGFDNP